MPSIRALAACALFASLAVLGAALLSERWGGLVPCALCLVERWPYRVAAVLAAAAVAMPRRWLLWAVAAAMAAGLGLATIHLGVENKLWPSPLPECAAPRFAGGSIAERLAAMPASVAKPCDDPVFPVPFLPVSMAAMNALASLAIGGGLAIILLRSRRRTP